VAGFNHDVFGPNATDYLAPFRSTSTGTGFVAGFRFGGHQLNPPPFAGMPPGGQPGALYGWEGSDPVTGRFNAIHMCLIPKGLYRGHVLVWNRYPVVLSPGTALDPQNRFWSCQAWSIVNPAVNVSCATLIGDSRTTLIGTRTHGLTALSQKERSSHGLTLAAR